MRELSNKVFLSLSAAIVVSSCGQGAPADKTNSSASTPSVTAQAAPTGDAAIAAAAEPFEKLTETAFTATPAVLDATIAEVRAAAQGVRGSLAPEGATSLDTRLADIDAARKTDNRADLAIAAVEGYRTLVSSAAPGAKVPAAVKLLDYAGFRYDADLKAKPPRWADMTQAASFGREQWATISSQVTDSALRANMDKALAEMADGASKRDAAVGSTAAQRELALVDDLEKYFGNR